MGSNCVIKVWEATYVMFFLKSKFGEMYVSIIVLKLVK